MTEEEKWDDVIVDRFGDVIWCCVAGKSREEGESKARKLFERALSYYLEDE